MRLLILFFLFALIRVSAQDTLIIQFAGDIMCHEAQIEAARDPETGAYDFSETFEEVSPLFSRADAVIANLETTLAGPPYQGYPRFSSPDELVAACREAGIGHLVTANNHACDKGKKGILRTIGVLELLDIDHTGTFRDTADRRRHNLMILQKGNLRTGILNYTYGTNGLPVPSPTRVNLIDTVQMLEDLASAQDDSLDMLIVFLHWGEQYQPLPNARQREIARFLFTHGVDMIIGSHPHVLQPMEFDPEGKEGKGTLIVNSLGNFISNQRSRGRDGGALVQVRLVKTPETLRIDSVGYYLTWVRKYMDKGKWHFRILPCRKYEENGFDGLDPYSAEKMRLFLQDARHLLEMHNRNFPEIR